MKSPIPEISLPAGKRGFIILALLLILVVGGSTLALGGLNNRQSVYLQKQQELREQMQDAKAVLLAYAANSSKLLGNTRGPGFFPCPDTTTTDPDNDGQITDATSTNCTTYIGRLPETVSTTAGVYPLNNYYADAGEQFWYAVSPRFTYSSTTTNRQSQRRTTTTNATYTATHLRLDNVSEYVALIIAPGEALASQDRESGVNSYGNYLENSNGSSYYYYTSNPSDPENFNDQIIGITIDEYIQAVGMNVALELRTKLNNYYTSNGFYPSSGSYSTFPTGTPSTTTQTTFRSAMASGTSSTVYPWLSTSTTNNAERWPTYTWYYRVNTTTARIAFSGCPGIYFEINQTATSTVPAVTRTGNSC